MAKAIELEVTPEGVLVPRPFLPDWEDVERVEIERRGDTVIIKPKANDIASVHNRIVRAMKADGLVETLPWEQQSTVSAEERAHLAEKLSQGKPLSKVIIDEREDRT